MKALTHNVFSLFLKRTADVLASRLSVVFRQLARIAAVSFVLYKEFNWHKSVSDDLYR